MKENTRF